MPVFAGIMHKEKEPAPTFSGPREVDEVESTKMPFDWGAQPNLPLGASAGHSWESISEAWMVDAHSASRGRRPGLDAVAPPDVDPAAKGFSPLPQGKGYSPPPVAVEGKGYSPPAVAVEGKGYPRCRDPLDPYDRTWDVKDWQRSSTGPPHRSRQAQLGVYGEVVEPSGKGGDRWTHDIFMTRSSMASMASTASGGGPPGGERRLKVPAGAGDRYRARLGLDEMPLPQGSVDDIRQRSPGMQDSLLFGDGRSPGTPGLITPPHVSPFNPYTHSGSSDATTVFGHSASVSPEAMKEELTFVPATEDRVSSHALEEMQYITDRGGESTVWMRVVHSGYGQDTWRTSLRTCGLTCVFAQSPSEGAYVHLPAGWNRQQLINTMNDINLDVRRRVRFRDMNRSNKSRLQFKQDLLTIAYPPWPNGRPTGPAPRVLEKPSAPRAVERPRTAADEWDLFMSPKMPETE